jgi:aspartyl-tRNA(Asn)/glutamyl-tRNA(Gln) amidotransferase subunit A
MGLYEITVTQAAELIRRRELSPVELVEALLRRIDALEPSLQAWETVDRNGALAAARTCETQAGEEGAGPLLGVPLGIKDIFYTAGLRTTSGSPLFKDFVPEHDATSVSRLRQAGAVVLGKTVTVQFAHFDPPPTRNPWNRDRTPGGSSSGSAAAVAARMVPAALGSQTGGSIVRPAAYCGVVGIKPSYGRISRYGVMPASWSLDHVGALARSVEDAALLLQTMAGHDPMDGASARVAVGDYVGAARRKESAPTLGFLTDYLESAEPEVAGHVRAMAARFEREGARVREVHLPAPMEDLLSIRAVVGQVEAAGLHAYSLRDHPEGYAPKIRDQVETGLLVPGFAYIQAQRLRGRLRPQVEEVFADIDCVLMPSTSDVAPDTSTTGRNHFQSVWSLFGFPAITLPSGLSKGRLPLAVQLVAGPFQEEKLLSAAAWCEAELGPMPAPSLG